MSNELQCNKSSSIGRWTKEEHYKFLQGIRLYGRNWKEISKYVGTRNGAQIRSHAQKYFDKINKCQQSSQNAEGLHQRLSSSGEQTSPHEEQTNVSYSYYLTEISKFVAETQGISFWEQLIGVQGKKCSAGQQQQEKKFKQSFVPYLKNTKEKDTLIIQSQN